jgi:hypothetical protein
MLDASMPERPGKQRTTRMPDSNEFSLKIDFERGTPAPSRVFRAISELIEAFEATDGIVAPTISPRITSILLLQAIETGSLVSRLKQVVESVDDGELRERKKRSSVHTS